MKQKRKILSLILTMVIVLSVFMNVGCRREDNKQNIDTTKTQLYIGLGSNGIDDWVNNFVKKFEEKYSEVSFEEGKKGVQVFAGEYNEKFQNFTTLPQRHSQYEQKLIITETIPYSTVKEMAIDITDAVTSSISLNPVTNSDSGEETATIQDKLLPQFKNYYGAENHYYALPAQETTFGLVYDVDLFNEKGFFFANEEAIAQDKLRSEDDKLLYEHVVKKNAYTGEENKSYYFVDYLSDWTEEELSQGADGKSGTYDDGLPATYEEFFALLDFMQSEGVEPIRWSGKVQSYMTQFLNSLAVDYESDEHMLMSTFNGTDTNLIKLDSNGKIEFENDGVTPKTYSQEINAQNGYLLARQGGYYHALSFLESLLKNDRYYDKDLCFKGIEDHKTTQSKFLLSRKQGKPIGMLVEGSWWQGEASRTFNDMAAEDPKWSVENRNFAYMPLPKQNKSLVGQTEGTNVVAEFIVFITNSVPSNLASAYKLLLKEMYSRDDLYDFAKITGQMRPVSLELTDSEYQSLTCFGQSNYNRHTYTNLYFKPSYSKVYTTNSGLFANVANFHWKTNGFGDVPSESMSAMNVTAKTYFEAICSNWNQTRWDAEFKGKAY